MKVTIYQIIPELDEQHLMYMDLSYVQQKGYDTPPAWLYEAVYHGNVNASTCEEIFRIFNRVTSADILYLEQIGFKGRSLSVSDIIEIWDSPDKSRFYFCQPVGFQRVHFRKASAAGSIVNHDYAPPEMHIQKGTFYTYFLNKGSMEIHLCYKIILRRYRYSRCELGYRLIIYPLGKKRKKYIHTSIMKPTVLLLNIFSMDSIQPSSVHTQILSNFHLDKQNMVLDK